MTSTARKLNEPESPKASCPACGRPVAILASGRCIYCGKPVPGKVRPSDKAQHDAAMAQAFAELETGHMSQGGGGFSKWGIRIGALGLGALLVFAFVGPCMKT